MTGLAGVVALLYLGGHPETSYDVLAGTVVFVAFRLIQRRRRRQPVLRPALGVGAGLVAGTGLAALSIVPFVELLLRSSDITTRRELTTGAGVPKEYLLGVVLPDYWGRPTSTVLEPFATFMADRAFYAGAVPLMLALIALVLRPSPRRLALAVAGLGCLGVVVGVEPFFALAEVFAGPAWMDRLTFFFLFAVGLLAGCGTDDVLELARSRTRRRAVFTVSAGLAFFPLAYMLVAGSLELDRFGEAIGQAWGFEDPSEDLKHQALGGDRPTRGAARVADTRRPRRGDPCAAATRKAA